MLKQTVGFLGAGKMGEALARGLLARKLVPRGRVLMSDADAERRAWLADALKVHVLAGNLELVHGSQIVVVALKPNTVREVVPGLAEAFSRDHLVISIAAGVTLAELEGMVPSGTRVVRVMPNTPCLVGAGASAFSLGSAARRADARVVAQLLGAVGICLEVPERLLDAVTGLSGSGPAYVALVIEALADGGVLAGLPRDVALKLAAQTTLGAARLVLDGGKHPAQLKDMVTSPGGTTIEAIKVLERGGLRAALIEAVEAATEKSRKLGQR